MSLRWAFLHMIGEYAGPSRMLLVAV